MRVGEADVVEVHQVVVTREIGDATCDGAKGLSR